MVFFSDPLHESSQIWVWVKNQILRDHNMFSICLVFMNILNHLIIGVANFDPYRCPYESVVWVRNFSKGGATQPQELKIYMNWNGNWNKQARRRIWLGKIDRTLVTGEKKRKPKISWKHGNTHDFNQWTTPPVVLHFFLLLSPCCRKGSASFPWQLSQSTGIPGAWVPQSIFNNPRWNLHRFSAGFAPWLLHNYFQTSSCIPFSSTFLSTCIGYLY